MRWTEERIEKLKKLWAEGLSASECAARIAPEITREAVCGKVHRLKLPYRRTGIRKKFNRVPRCKPMHKPKPQPPSRHTIAVEPVAEADTWKALRNTTPVAIADLTPDACRWPIGDAPTRYCGCKKIAGISYCATHAAKAFQPPKVRQIAPVVRTTGHDVIDTVKEPA